MHSSAISKHTGATFNCNYSVIIGSNVPQVYSQICIHEWLDRKGVVPKAATRSSPGLSGGCCRDLATLFTFDIRLPHHNSMRQNQKFQQNHHNVL
jgi:hypothetical protein